MLNDEQIDTLLATELAKIGAVSGAIGGGVSGAVNAATGAFVAGKLLKTDKQTETVNFTVPNQEVLTTVSRVFSNKPFTPGADGTQIITDVKHSGFLNMNPVVVIGIVKDSSVQLIAGAKEGLIRQKTAKKALAAVVSQLKI